MSARERILDAAADIMRRHGVARATTKEIAKAAGYSEALLYKHFRDKEELILHVLKDRMPAFTSMGVPGEGTVESNLVAVVHGGLRFYRRAFPMMASMVAQRRLMEATRDSLRNYGAGPQEPVHALTRYLDAERDLGRVAARRRHAGRGGAGDGRLLPAGVPALLHGRRDRPGPAGVVRPRPGPPRPPGPAALGGDRRQALRGPVARVTAPDRHKGPASGISCVTSRFSIRPWRTL
ncbi:TetR/AcrR family transcriptional regulator [Actinomadura madurae]|uniref:TetR/AcrR family transcriptional regulator n=1 Tax=Actinomadura madurae TaxID=1993 RepID=UPI0020D226F6|nr:TetR/AcrR family transcriptional regulator [Actinomadura madurae]MCQ0020386.1 TetR/AcrR family transcriptional regulator [Actinomadura madurae]